MVPPGDETLDQELADLKGDTEVKRDAWMQAPSALDVDYVQRKKKEEKTQYVRATEASDLKLAMHDAELNRGLGGNEEVEGVTDEPAQRDVSYKFGDSGSQWRMTKLKAVYQTAKETGRPVEEIALERYGDLRDFDEAREEEIEVERMAMYGQGYVGKEKPSGELYAERKLKAGIHRSPQTHEELDLPQAEIVPDPRPTTQTVKLDATALNRLKAQMLKAKMKKAPNAAQLEEEYNAALAGAANNRESDVVVLGAMDNRMLAGGRQGEVKTVDNKRGRERGTLVENEDMSIEDMVRQERRTKGQPGGEGLLLAEKIAKDAKFDVSPLFPYQIYLSP